MAYQVGYWTDLNTIKLEETADSAVSTFQAFPYGTYNHPVYGEIDFTPDKANEVVANFNANARGTEIDIDYDHKAKTTEAAGWVKGAETRSDGLYLTVEWTKQAAQKILSKAYKYFSPEFADEWKHPKTGVTYKNVLFGGGITNRPFLKDILPLNMSELFDGQQSKEGNWMDPKELRKKLGLPEDATDEQVDAALVAKVEPKEENGSSEALAASENVLEAIKKLSEDNPIVKQLADQVTAMSDQLKIQGAALKLAETQNVVKKLTEPVDGRQLPAVVTNKLTAILVEAPKSLSDKIVELIGDLNKTGYVQLGEIGHSSSRSEGSDADAVKKFTEEVNKVMEADKLNYSDAVSRVASLNEDLFDAYRTASYNTSMV